LGATADQVPGPVSPGRVLGGDKSGKIHVAQDQKYSRCLDNPIELLDIPIRIVISFLVLGWGLPLMKSIYPTRLSHAALVFARIVLASFFLVSGISKALDINSTRIAVANYKVLPSFLIPLAACVLIAVEILLGIALILGIYRRIFYSLGIVILTLFSLVMFISLNRGEAFDCGCMGSVIKSKISLALIVRNLFLILVFVGMYSFKPDNSPGPSKLEKDGDA
jgi:uncharacterized membrane protein YphA (DoxX/SURF4 family)